MKPLVCQGAILKCSFGNAGTPLMVLPDKKVNAPLPAAGKNDCIPLVNILPFGMCSNPANPVVAAATAAAMGVLTPAPCIPCIAGTWIGTCCKVKVKGADAVTKDSRLQCAYGGCIEVTAPSQTKVLV